MALTSTASALQMALTVEGALRETTPGSVMHVAAAAKLWDVAHAREGAASGTAAAAAAQLAALAVRARYGDVGELLPKILNAYLESDVAPW